MCPHLYRSCFLSLPLLAQIQQDPSVETTEDTAISINCSHPNLPRTDFIGWYRQFPGRGPEFLVSALKGFKQLEDPKGRLSVAADRRSNVLWLAQPRLRDAAVYYCVQDHGEKNRDQSRLCSPTFLPFQHKVADLVQDALGTLQFSSH
uniref:Uncharacterized protein n=1 Tax=Melopsittacus undulatus TaxID=13146 RepID=A0A8C6IS89_MELUD